MVKDKNFWILAGVGVIGFSVCTAHGLMCLRQIGAEFAGEMGELVAKGFFSLILSLFVGFGILMACTCGMMRLRHAELYLENQLTHAIVDSGCSLILEYCDRTKKQRWLGDAQHIFKAKEWNLTLEELAHPDDFPMLNQQMEDVKRGILYSVDVRLKDAEGEYRICSFQMVPIGAVRGRLSRVLGIVQDVDAERRKTRELMEERNRLRCYLEDIQGGSAISDARCSEVMDICV